MPVAELPTNLQGYECTIRVEKDVINERSLFYHPTTTHISNFKYGLKRGKVSRVLTINSQPTIFYKIDNEENRLTKSDLENIHLLTSYYKKEFNRVKDKIAFSEKDINNIFTSIRNNFFKLPIDKCAFDINQEQFAVTFLFTDGSKLMISKFLKSSAEDIGSNDILYSYFIDNTMISSDVINFDQFTKKFKEYMSV